MSFLQVGGIVVSSIGIVAMVTLPFVRISYSKCKKQNYSSRDGQTVWVVESELISDEQNNSMTETTLGRFTLVHMVSWILLPLGFVLMLCGTK